MFEFTSKIKECDQLKKELDSFRPFSQPVVKQLKEYYKINLTYTSNAIEGNSLTESETKVVIEDGITIGGKPLKDHLEALGHALAYDYIYALAGNKKEITEADILKMHHLFYEKIDENNAGQYRKVPVCRRQWPSRPAVNELGATPSRLCGYYCPASYQNKLSRGD